MTNVNTAIAFDVIEESLETAFSGNSISNNIQVGDRTLESTTISTTGITKSDLPQFLLERFSGWVTMSSAQAYEATSLVMGVVPMRVENGAIAPAALSIQGASKNRKDQKYPTKVIKSMDKAFPRLAPDYCVSCGLYEEPESGKVVAVPSLMKNPYPAQDGAMVLKLTYKNDSLDQPMIQELEKQIIGVHKKLGVRDGDPFLICFIGYACHEHAFSGKGDKKPWYALGFPQGGYMIGGCKVSKKVALPEGLSSLKVETNLMVKGSSVLDRLAAELTSTHVIPSNTQVVEPVNLPINNSTEEVEESEFECNPTNEFDISSLSSNEPESSDVLEQEEEFQCNPTNDFDISRLMPGSDPAPANLASALPEQCKTNQNDKDLPDPFSMI